MRSWPSFPHVAQHIGDAAVRPFPKDVGVVQGVDAAIVKLHPAVRLRVDGTRVMSHFCRLAEMVDHWRERGGVRHDGVEDNDNGRAGVERAEERERDESTEVDVPPCKAYFALESWSREALLSHSGKRESEMR